MQLSQRQIFLIGIIIILVGASIYFFYSNIKGEVQPGPGAKKTKISVWGNDESRAFSTIIKNFETIRKDVSVNYIQLNEDLISKQLTEALARGEGPDVIMIKNRSWVKQKNLLMPAPATIISLSGLRQSFPTVVEQDFVDNQKQIYALPLSIDTLALVYNKEFFDQAKLIRPPATWSELAELVPQLVKISSGGEISRAAIAMGGSAKSVTNAGDIMATLFMQSGINWGQDKLGDIGGKGEKAFDYYIQFSNPRSLAYTWSDIKDNDLQSFVNLKSVMAIVYRKQLVSIIEQNNFLNYRISLLPQISEDRRVDYADYWGLAVTRASKNSALAWDFIRYAALTPQNAESYINETKAPPALLSLLRKNFENTELGTFSQQAITARSWKASDDAQVRTVFSDMISAYLTGQLDRNRTLERTDNLISQLLTK